MNFDLQVDENEMRDFFARYGAVKEVKIITYRGGICKGWENKQLCICVL